MGHRRADRPDSPRTRRRGRSPRRGRLHRTCLPLRGQLPAGTHAGSGPSLRHPDRGGHHRPQPLAHPGCAGCLRITVGTPRRTPGSSKPSKISDHEKALFIDRDGTIVAEPADQQIDSLGKLEFVPGAISALKALAGLDFELVLASNQDGWEPTPFPKRRSCPHTKRCSRRSAAKGSNSPTS